MKETKIQAMVEVQFMDGEQIDYPITANLGIARALAERSGETGVLALWNGEESYGVPVAHVRDWTVRELTEEEDLEHNGPATVEGAEGAVAA